MKIQFKLQGNFYRLPQPDTYPETVSLEELSQTIKTIAAKNNCRHFQQVYNHFGFDFLPQTTVKELLALETYLFSLPLLITERRSTNLSFLLIDKPQ